MYYLFNPQAVPGSQIGTGHALLLATSVAFGDAGIDLEASMWSAAKPVISIPRTNVRAAIFMMAILNPYVVESFFLLLIEATSGSWLTNRHGRCAVARYHAGSWGRCDRLGGQHVVGSETSDEHSENEGADCSFHGRVSFSYYEFEFAA